MSYLTGVLQDFFGKNIYQPAQDGGAVQSAYHDGLYVLDGDEGSQLVVVVPEMPGPASGELNRFFVSADSGREFREAIVIAKSSIAHPGTSVVKRFFFIQGHTQPTLLGLQYDVCESAFSFGYDFDRWMPLQERPKSSSITIVESAVFCFLSSTTRA